MVIQVDIFGNCCRVVADAIILGDLLAKKETRIIAHEFEASTRKVFVAREENFELFK